MSREEEEKGKKVMKGSSYSVRSGEDHLDFSSGLPLTTCMTLSKSLIPSVPSHSSL